MAIGNFTPDVPGEFVYVLDGSGGRHTRDPRLRRCDWAAVCIAFVHGEPVWQGAIYGGLPGSKQTTPRTELYALLQALLRAPSLGDVASDRAFVVKGFSRRRWKEPSSNGYIWHRIGEALGSTPPIVRKVKAHTFFEDLRIGFISYFDSWHG